MPPLEELLKGLENRRLDLMALRLGYQSEEETLRQAVLEQFPKVNLGFNTGRDDTNVHTVGFGVTVDLPIFDRNQGAIATEKATRQRLFDEYAQRLFEARSDVAMALEDLAAISDQIDASNKTLSGLQKLVATYRSALQSGNLDVISYYQTVSDLVQKELDILKLKQQLMDNLVALELAAGEYFPVTTTAPATTQNSPAIEAP
jgi:outer membrane protein TolC